MAMRSASSHFDARAAFVSLAAHGFAVGAIAVASAGLGPLPPTVEPARATYMVIEASLVTLPEKAEALQDSATAEPSPPPLPPAQAEIPLPQESAAQSATTKSAAPKVSTSKAATPKAVTPKVPPIPAAAPIATAQVSAAAPAESEGAASESSAMPDILPVAPAAAVLAPSDAPAGPAAGPAQGAVAEVQAPVVRTARFRVPPSPPIYPRRAIELDLRGTTILRALVDVDGAAAEIVVWASSGLRLLDDAAIAAARGWKFEPAREGAVAIAAWVEVPVRFELR